MSKNTFSKSDLIAEVAKKANLKQKDAKAAVDAAFDIISEKVKTQNVALHAFGTFKVSSRAARKGRNPQTGAEMTIKASKSVSFKPASVLKESVN